MKLFPFLLMASLLSGYAQSVTQVRTSWYGAECAGKKMANGQPFKPGALTCASWDYALGTKLRVTRGDRSVVVTVTDRGPAKRLLDTRRLDLSEAAFSRLAPTSAGILKVHIEAVPPAR
jgi:rare lipoprotein A